MEKLVKIVEEKFGIKPKVSQYRNGMSCICSYNENIRLEIFVEPRSNKELMGSYIKIYYLTNLQSEYFDMVDINPNIIAIHIKDKYRDRSICKILYDSLTSVIKDCEEKILEGVERDVRPFEISLYSWFSSNCGYYNYRTTLIADFCDNLNDKDFVTVFKNCIKVIKGLESIIVEKTYKLIHYWCKFED